MFSKLDLKQDYHQLELHPESRHITTFVTHCGLYRYTRLCFGINAASEIYQHEIHKVIQGIEGVANISDDIIVHGEDREEHDKRLRKIMGRLQTAGLTLNADKCRLGVSQLTFMGHQLSDKGIDPTKDRIKAVVEAREPENAKEVRSFQGLMNYSAKFIPNFTSIAERLRCLTRKDEPFRFGPEERRSFNKLRECLTKSETLGYFDLKAKTTTIADASPVGLGVVLIQKQNDGPRVISYASRSLSDVERRYSQTERDALGLVWACERFNAYVFGVEFDLITDNKPLEAIYGPRSKPCARI